MKPKYHVVIVGSGIGGLAAAQTLAGKGLDILLIDENLHTGGQLLRTTGSFSKKWMQFTPDIMKKRGYSLIRNTEKHFQDIDKIHQAQVLGIFKDRRLLVHIPDENHQDKKKTGDTITGKILDVQAEHLILATGARERYLPFKGWTLPGVISLGAAQILMKSHGVLPAESTLIAGTSPLMMVLAAEILSNKGKVVAVLDENPFKKKIGFLPLIRYHWPKLFEGAFYTMQMMLRCVPMNSQTRVIEARGKNRLESVVTAKTTADGQIINGSQVEHTTHSLAVGYGFVPNIELAVQAGCKTEYHPTLGGWVVRADETLESSIEAIYAVGEITGIAGAKKSFIQGKIAGLSILKKLGKINVKKGEHHFRSQMEHLSALNREQEAYAGFLNHLCRVPASVYSEIPEDTLICRCENISMGTIKKAIKHDFITSGGIKKATRCGMGRCQGRICGPVIMDIIRALTGKNPEEIGSSLARAPVKNTPIRSFLNQTVQ